MAATEDSFMEAVQEGLNLSKRLYFGKDRSVAPPKPPPPMSKNPRSYLPTAPMVYAVITDPGIVDNPDIPSYQPYVYGRCDPPALIPLQMNTVSLEVESYLDTVFVTVSGQWRVHCVMGSKACDCRLVVPMGEQGSILGVEIDVPRKSYHTQLIAAEDKKVEGKAPGVDEEAFMRSDIFFLTIPQVDGGTNLSIKMRWSQKLLYHDGEFTISIPFCFPEYVTPASKKIPKKEKILLNVHPGDGSEVLCKNVSHPLKEQRRQVDFLSFLYESDVLTWSNRDFSFSYSVPASGIYGNVFLQSPSIDDVDQREMFCIQIVSGKRQSKKVFSKSVVYVVDISGSMTGKPFDAAKISLCGALSKLDLEDKFNIIAFNENILLFSSTMKLANQETIERATQWMDTLHVGGGTKISLALDKAMDMMSDKPNSLPMIFLITDGAVEDERNICNVVKNRLSNLKQICPRIHTFGIGLYCNHYFLRMLAMIGRGHYDAAYEADYVESRLQKLITKASSTVLANITFDTLAELEDAEVHPISVLDLSSESVLIVTGRYRGNFPENFKARGISSDLTIYDMDLMVHKAKAIPLKRILAIEQIGIYTAQAWLWEDKQLVEKVVKMSIHNGIISEYTSMALLVTLTLKREAEIVGKQKKTSNASEAQKDDPKPHIVKVMRNDIGFGDIKATIENIPSGCREPKAPEAAEMMIKAASDCCTRVCGYCCCMCCIQACSKVNNQCAIVFTQLCTALACFGCIECCTEICCRGSDN